MIHRCHICWRSFMGDAARTQTQICLAPNPPLLPTLSNHCIDCHFYDPYTSNTHPHPTRCCRGACSFQSPSWLLQGESGSQPSQSLARKLWTQSTSRTAAPNSDVQLVRLKLIQPFKEQFGKVSHNWKMSYSLMQPFLFQKVITSGHSVHIRDVHCRQPMAMMTDTSKCSLMDELCVHQWGNGDRSPHAATGS